MKLKAKIFDILTGGPFVAVLHKHDAEMLSLTSLDRIRVKNSEEIVCVADITASREVLQEGQIGIFLDLSRIIGVKEGDFLEVSFELKPKSLIYIKKKLDGAELKEEEINEIIKD